MTRLAPNLFQRRYDDLVGIGLSKLPSYAPAWTDYNAHDPGITLIELLAWVGEAQLYSLSRSRRDERRAYAALMGVEPHGARPATGLIWPDPNDPTGPAATIARQKIFEPGLGVSVDRTQAPQFQTKLSQLWIPARVAALTTLLRDGSIINQLPASNRGGPPFQPFGSDEASPGVLRMDLAAIGHDPLFEQREIMDGNLVIGVRADPAGTTIANADKSCGHSPVQVTLVVGTKRIPLPIVEDSSGGMLRTGALVLDVSAVDIRPMKATLEFRATGLERAPRLVRIAPNVLPIFQSIKGQTTNPATGEPDQTFDLDGRGLEFEPGSDPVTVVVSNEATSETWSKTERLDACGPNDKKFELDTVAARISFGNGVNGAVPPLGSTITASYFLSQGQAGNIAANRKWVVHGFSGAFGSNPDATFGGEDPSGWLEQRREARLRLNDGHALVSAADFQQAAVQLPSLEVGRAWMVSPSQGDLQTGTLRLVAMRARTAAGESGAPPESRQWLESIRERLAPRVPLGMRLSVIAPRYVEFTIQAIVEAERRMDPDSVKADIRAELQRRLTLVSSTRANPARQFGVPVSRQDLSAWIQSLLSVKQALQLSIQVQGATRDTVELSPIGLPRIDLDNSKITVVRSGEGGAA